MDIWNDYECDEQMDIFDFLGDEIKISVEKPIKLIEMFSGYGSQALALKYLGIPFEHHFVCELDKYACASYSAVHGIDVQPTDIRQVHAEDLNITETDKFTYFLTYSFPCVDLSVSGKGKGMSKQDWLNGNSTRSGLLWEVERILKELHQSDEYELPQILMMENVTQVHGIAQQIDWKNWIQTLEDLGYVSFWSDLNAKDFGVPQNRERTLMFSFLKKEFGSGIVYRFPRPFELNHNIEDVLEKEVEEKFYLSGEAIDKMVENFKEQEYATDKKYLCFVQDMGAVLEKVSDIACTLRARDYKGFDNFRSNAVIEVVGHYMPSGHDSSRVVNPKGIAPTVMGNNCTVTAVIVAMRGRNPDNPTSRKHSDLYVQQLEPNKQGICNTLTTVDKDNLVYKPDEYRVRRLTPREYGRLMGVQDQDIDKILSTVSNSQAYKQFGNSIVVDVMMECFKNLNIKGEKQ